MKVGGAAITGAGEPHARHVIHAASMALGGRTTTQSLKSSMKQVFRLAQEHDVRSIAIPAVMAGCLRDALAGGWSPEEVRLVLFSEAAKHAFEGPFIAALGVI